MDQWVSLTWRKLESLNFNISTYLGFGKEIKNVDSATHGMSNKN